MAPSDEPAGPGPAKPPPAVRVLGTVPAANAVPVYNCYVYLSGPAGGPVTARGATLPEVTARGASEREALQNVVRAFKQAISRYTAEGQDIPWVDPPLPMAAGERPRWVPVHF
jgi:hypothetical protein